MDPIRTLLLARTHLVILDADRVAAAATRPTRDSDLEKFEDELAQLGFVMSLDLALTIRRLPHQALAELRTWIVDTLAKTMGASRPHVPLFPAFPVGTPGDMSPLYLRRILTWLLTRADQPCPWCGQVKAISALDACGHLVCRTCWEGGSFLGCPICHRRVAIGDPFIKPPPGTHHELVQRHAGALRLLHLGFDLVGSAQARFELILGRATRLSPDDRLEVETVIDSLGPKPAAWLPKRIPNKETMAVVLARLWIVSPDRSAMARATMAHLRSATDVLRVAIVLMGGHPALTPPIKLKSISRGLRRAVLEALDRLPMEVLVEDVRRHPGLWKRVGECLHPYEHAKRLPTAALAFAVVRGTSVDKATFGATLRAQANQLGSVRIEDDRVRVTAWAAGVEEGLRSGNVRAVADRLGHRPDELLRRADHLVRVTQARQPEALPAVLASITKAAARGTPAILLTLAAHIGKRGSPWPRRVMFPTACVLRAWSMPDTRIPLDAVAIGSIVETIRAELVARAGTQRHYPRAVLDRGLVDLLVPRGDRLPAPAKIAWPRGSADLTIGARATLWEVACIHAAARANIVYVRERDGSITSYRRRDDEAMVARLARLLSGSSDDGKLPTIPPANAPTWFAVLRDDLTIPKGSAGYVLDARALDPASFVRVAADGLVAELTAKP